MGGLSWGPHLPAPIVHFNGMLCEQQCFVLVDVLGLDAIACCGTGSHVLDAVVEGVVLRPVVPSCAVNSAVLAVVDMSYGRSCRACACNIAGLRPNRGGGAGRWFYYVSQMGFAWVHL